jgi:hypothetical protein
MKTVHGIPKDFSASQKMIAVHYIGTDKQRFGKVMEEFFKGPYRHTQRAAGAVVEVVKRHPEMLRPYLRRFFIQLDQEGSYPAMTRNILRILQFVDIPKSLEGRAVNTAMRIMQDPNELVAAKVFAMTLLANVASHHPELRNEVREVISKQYPHGTPAYRSRARKTLSVLGG